MDDLEQRILEARLQQALDARGAPQPEFTAGRAGEMPPQYAPDIPAPMDPNAPTVAPPMSLGDQLRQQFLMGGATDVRNMAAGAAPSGLQMALARMAGRVGATGKQAAATAYDAAEQMFDYARPAPVMGAAGALAAGAASAGEVPHPNALKLPKGASFGQIAADMNLPVNEFRAKYNGLLPEEAMSALEDRNTRNPSWYKRPFVTHPDDKPRPVKKSSLDGAQVAKVYSGAGPRRDKKLRDAEDEATRT